MELENVLSNIVSSYLVVKVRIVLVLSCCPVGAGGVRVVGGVGRGAGHRAAGPVRVRYHWGN